MNPYWQRFVLLLALLTVVALAYLAILWSRSHPTTSPAQALKLPTLQPSPIRQDNSTPTTVKAQPDSLPTVLPGPNAGMVPTLTEEVPSSTSLPELKNSVLDLKTQFATGIQYYISPTGNDAEPGTNLSSPWKTFSLAIPKLQPGDTLILLDGIYTLQNSGMIEINCTSEGGAQNGTASAPIVIQAQNERKALLQSDGSVPAVYIEFCAHWVISGLGATSADLPIADRNHVFSIRDSTDITLYRLLGAYSNRYFNSHIYSVNASTNILILECEAYFFHRHGFDVFQSHQVAIRRSYANSRNYPDIPGGYISDRPGGDETYVLYHSSNSIVENSIAEYHTRGFEVHGGVTFDGLPGGHDNKILGSIHLNGHYGAEVDSRSVDGVIRTAANNLYKDFLVINAQGNGFNLRSAVGARLENVTIYNSGATGIRANDKDSIDPYCSRIPGGCSFTITNSLIFNNQSYGLSITIPDLYTWQVAFSNIVGNSRENFPGPENISDDVGNIQRSLSVAPTGLGLQGNQTLVYIPAGSNMKSAGKGGADIGANILYRYENGLLTNAPLWDPQTGTFPCGALVPGINDLPGFSCFDVNQRLNVNANTLPPDYLTRFK